MIRGITLKLIKEWPAYLVLFVLTTVKVTGVLAFDLSKGMELIFDAVIILFLMIMILLNCRNISLLNRNKMSAAPNDTEAKESSYRNQKSTQIAFIILKLILIFSEILDLIRDIQIFRIMLEK